MNVTAVMEELSTKLGVITGLNVYPWSVRKVRPPAASIALPTEIEFDQTYGRGLDKITLELLVVVGLANARSATEELAAYLAGSGPSSVKQALEGKGTSYHRAHVPSAEPQVVTIESQQYQGASFTVVVFGQGG